MIAPFDPKTTTLRDTVLVLNAEAAKERRSSEARQQLPRLWSGAVKRLFDRIESVYLIEFLILNAMSIQRTSSSFFVPGCAPFDVESLTLLIGDARIKICPYFYTSGRVSVRIVSRQHDEVIDLFCDLADADANPTWTVELREQGVRRLLEAYLPKKAVALDEMLFRDLLNRSLCGPQPIFAMRADAIRNRLGDLLDFVTSAELRRGLSLGVRSGASEIGRQLLLAAPSAAKTSRRTLPALAARPHDRHATAKLAYHSEAEGAGGDVKEPEPAAALVGKAPARR